MHGFGLHVYNVIFLHEFPIVVSYMMFYSFSCLIHSAPS
jgi:hypothetical protein